MTPPAQGAIVSVFLPDTLGHEQRGRRPCLVVSQTAFNHTTGQAFVCPITTVDRGYPFHIPLPSGLPVRGAVMVDQLRAVDYEERKARSLAHVPPSFLRDILSVLGAVVSQEKS